MNIIDAHAHIASWPTLEQSKFDVIDGMNRHNISFSLVSNADGATFPSVQTGLEREKSALECLEEVFALASDNPGRIGAAVWVRPQREPFPTPELENAIQANRSLVHAYKFHPYCERTELDSPLFDPYLESARCLDLPVLVHTAYDPYSGIGRLVNVAKKYPDILFVAAHLELCTDHDYAIEAIKDIENIYADTAWVPMEKAKKALDVMGRHRVMFGSDAPLDGARTLDQDIYSAYFENRLGLDEEAYYLLMEGNARRIYHID